MGMSPNSDNKLMLIKTTKQTRIQDVQKSQTKPSACPRATGPTAHPKLGALPDESDAIVFVAGNTRICGV
eukprot:11183191-Lingulodinium_polyedra.AAC.1